MAQTVRLPNMSLSVANTDAVTVGSRVAGLVTSGPTIMRSVAERICEWMTYGSCHRMCESNVQAWVKPSSSARRESSITRPGGRVGLERQAEVHGDPGLSGPPGPVEGAERQLVQRPHRQLEVLDRRCPRPWCG